MTSTPSPPPPDGAGVAESLDAFATWVVRSVVSRERSLTAISTLGTLDRTGPLRLSDLAATENVAQPSMTSLVGRLERDGLAHREADPTDGRAVRVSITDEGRAVLARRHRRRSAALDDLLADLDAGDRELIAAAAPALARLAARTPGGIPPRPTSEETSS